MFDIMLCEEKWLSGEIDLNSITIKYNYANCGFMSLNVDKDEYSSSNDFRGEWLLLLIIQLLELRDVHELAKSPH